MELSRVAKQVTKPCFVTLNEYFVPACDWVQRTLAGLIKYVTKGYTLKYMVQMIGVSSTQCAPIYETKSLLADCKYGGFCLQCKFVSWILAHLHLQFKGM